MSHKLTTRDAFIYYLIIQGACNVSMEWVHKTKGTPRQLVLKAWKQGHHDWLEWLLKRLDVRYDRCMSGFCTICNGRDVQLPIRNILKRMGYKR